MTDGDPDAPLEPSGIAQFVEHDRCPRYLKQRVDPGDEPAARDWREAFGLMNIALLGHGREFEATQIEALAMGATKCIGPESTTGETAGVPALTVDETWRDSPRGRAEQLRAAVAEAQTLPSTEEAYILCYQVPLGGQIGDTAIRGDADCLVLAPASANTAGDDDSLSRQPADAPAHEAPTDAGVLARVIDCKSAHDEQPAHRIQVATYCALLEQTLAEGPRDISCHIEASVLTQTAASTREACDSPFDLPTFRREEWELFVAQLLSADGAVERALGTDLQDLPFTLDQVCDNCAYKEACATRAVEDPTDPASLALLGLDARTQRRLHEADITSLRALSELHPRLERPAPTDDPPQLELPPAAQRSLEEALPGPIHETIQRAQALRGKIDPDYPSNTRPQAIPGHDWVPLPDDRCAGWSNIDGAAPGELVHVALFVRPDTAIDRIGALGACVYADAHGEYVTVGEVIDAVPDDPEVAEPVERDLFERFLTQLFGAIESVATALGAPDQTVIHCYTYSTHETETLAAGLDRHADSLDRARALRALVSLDPDGHTGADQSMLSAVQPIINDHFALQYPSQGLLAVVGQFVRTWTIEAFDPLDGRPDAPPLRAIFREQFLNDRVPYLADDPGIRLHLARGPLAEGPAAEAVEADHLSPDGWYPIRKRSGGQFPLEYLWAVTPKRPGDAIPRLTPEIVEEWAVDDEHEPLYRQEIGRFYYRTREQDEPLQRRDVEYLVERLAYALMRLVESIPYKDTYHEKDPLDATALDDFHLPVTRLPEAARDYLRMEFGAARERTRTHYRQPLRDRTRSGRSIPVRCTDYARDDDGSLVITGELAYDDIFADGATARQVARQARVRTSAGPGGGSWRVLTPLTAHSGAADAPTPDDTAESTPEDTPAPMAAPAARGHIETAVDDPATIQHSPPVLITNLDQQTGTITLKAFPERFRRHGSEFRVDHCGWHCPAGSNLTDPTKSPADRPGYVAGRPPVWIDTDELFVLDPMLDDFSAPKADRALTPETIEHNALYRQLRAIRHTGQRQAASVCAPTAIETFLGTVANAEGCLDPNDCQARFIRAVDRAIVPLQGPPGTGKTRGGTAPALLARAYARAQHDERFLGLVIAPSHEAVDATLEGVFDCLADWRTATGGLSALDLVRVLPTTPPPEETRVDAAMPAVDVTYCNYHSDSDTARLRTLASDVLGGHATGEDDATQWLLFATPATLYRTLGVLAEALPAIDGDSAPAAMRHDPGLADVVCIDEASMLDLPNLFLATSTLKPTGQTLLVGDHRQLGTVTEMDWAETARKPLTETKAYLSALEYIQWRNARGSHADRQTAGSTDDGTHQTLLSGFDTAGATPPNGGRER